MVGISGWLSGQASPPGAIWLALISGPNCGPKSPADLCSTGSDAESTAFKFGPSSCAWN